VRILIALVASLGLATIALAQTATPAPDSPAAAPKAVKKDDKVKCRMEAPIGSLVSKKVCTTTRAEDANRDNAKALLQRPVQGLPPL
jgi:uncharacterized protein (DUF2147 family)